MASRRMAAIAYAFIAFAVCPLIYSAPTPQHTCAPQCSERGHSIVHYEQGKTYIYNFDTEVVTQLVGSTDETNRIKVKGQAAVAAQSSCDLVLTIQNIAITSTSGQAISSVSDIEGSSIRFGYNDGVISDVCLGDDDPTWSANIKRAIVSMLGNRALNGDSETIETDVNGKCPTIHEHSGNKYKKTKDLQACTERDGGMSHIYGVAFTAPSKYHAIPLFQSTLTCTQELGKGVIQSSECTEGHAMDVIHSSGVRTDIKSTLALADVQSNLVKGRDTNKKSCLLFDFDDIDGVNRQKASATNANTLLGKICTEIESGTVSLKVPGLLLQLRKELRYALKDDISHLHKEISGGKICQAATKQLNKLLLDASAMSAGDGAIAFLADVLATEEVEDTTKDLFIAHAAFAEHPGAEALTSLQALVSSPNVNSEYLLAASGYAHQYCKLVNQDCGSCEKYQGLVNALAQHVKVETEEEAVEKVIVALQALGNLDNLTPAAVTAITTLIEDSHTSQRLKVRALDAARRDSCEHTLKKKAIKIFSDIKESSQVRIQAYLTLSKCLTPEDVPVIQAVVDNDEESNQVGSFVVSHVSNLLESSAPTKQDLKKVFKLINLREFPSDFRKFSRNFELSIFDPSMMNSGLAFESNVIFSQDSYIPRCSNANFTIDAFGRSYNLMELGLCVEDFEDIFERIIGPTSKLRAITLEDIVRESADKLSKLKNSISNRFKRDVAVDVHQNEIDAIRSEVDIHERTGDNANGDLYVRILGTAILAESFSSKGLTNDHALTARIVRAMEKLAEGVHEQNIDITEPFMFLDDEIVIPTSFGLPLTVTTEGTSVLSLQINGNLDVPSLFRGNNGDMKAKVMPSAATVIRAKMVLGDGPLQSGLQVEGKIHSAAGLELGVVRENNKFELRVNIPQERIQVFDVRSDIYWVEQSVDQLEKKTPVKPKMETRTLIENQCTTMFDKVLGLKVCADARIPQISSAAPFFFFNGQSAASLSIEKTEASMQGYLLKVETVKESETYGLDLEFDTPGSTTNRKVIAHARAVGPYSLTPQYTLKVESPLSNVEVNYKRSFTDDLKGVELRVDVNGDAYTGIAEVRKTSEGAGYRLVPLVQYQLPHGNPVKLLEGEITRVPGQKMNIDVKTGGPFRSARGSIKGTVVITKNEADNVEIEYKDLEFASEVAGKVLIDGSYKRSGKLIDVKFDSKYGQEAQHTLTLDATVGSPAPRENVLKLTTRSSRREFLNFDLDWSLKRGTNEIDHSLKYTSGDSAQPRILISQKSEIKIVSIKDFDVESDFTVKYPSYGVDFHAEAEAKSVPGQERHAKVEVKANDITAKADYAASGELLSNYKILGQVVAGEKTYEISEVATKVDDNKRHYKSHISVKPGFYYDADTDVYLKYAKGEFKSDLSTTVTSDQLENPIILKSTVSAKSDGYDANFKLDAQGKNYVDLQTNHQIIRSSGSPTSYNTKMKAHVLNYVDAKLTNTYAGGNGDLVLDALFVKSGRRIAGTSTVHRNGDVYDLKADLKWDADRDASRAISLKSSTTLSFSELSLDSKNDISVIGKTAKINLRGALSRDILNGESTGEFDYTSPSGKTYSVGSKINLENQPTSRGGTINLRIAPADVQPSELEFGVRASNINEQDRTFDLKADIKANYRNQKDIKVHGELSSTKPGNHRSYAARLHAEGSAIPKPLELSLKADLKSGRIALKGESVSPVKSTLDATIDYDYKSPKKTVGIKYSITTPIDRIQSLEGELQGAYMFNSYKNFEFSNLASVTLNGGSPYSVSNSLSVLENEAKYEHKYVSEGQQIVTITAEGKLDRRHLRAHLETNVRGTVSKLNLDVQHGLPNFAVTLDGETTMNGANRNFELRVENKKSDDGILDTEFLVIVDDENQLRITNKLENTPQRKSLDVLVATGEEIRKLLLVFKEEESGKYNVEALVKWGGENKFISTKGSLTKESGSWVGELSLDSPYFNADKFSVRVSKSLKNGEHGLDISIEGNNKKQLDIEMTFAARTESDYSKTYEGTLKVEGQAVGNKPVDFNGKFRLDDTKLDRARDNGEEGRSIKAAIDITNNKEPTKLKLLAKRSNKENRLQLHFCKNSESDCRVGNVQLKHSHEENGDLDYELRITSEEVAGGATKETNGIVFQSKFNRAERLFEHVGKLIINQEKAEQIGYRVYCNPGGKEVGAEILLPARVIALVLTGERPSSGGYNGELAFYIDKTKKADRKISLQLNIGQKVKTTDSASGRTLEVVFQHPELNKDLKIKSRYACGGESTYLELETLVDVLQAGHEIVATYSIGKQDVSEGRVYTSVLSVVSKGLHINFGVKEELKYVNRELSYKSVISYENREREIKTAQILFGVTKQRFNFEIDGPNAKVLSIINSYEHHATNCELRLETFLPGMEDTRIVRLIVHTVSPRNLQMKISTSSYAAEQYVEGFLGFRSEDELAAGVYDHLADGRHVIADLSFSLNGTRILAVKSDWNKDNAQTVLTRMQQRTEKHADKLRELVSHAIGEVQQEVKNVADNIRTAIPNVEVIATAARTQLTELKQELDANDDTKIVVQKLSLASAYFRQFSRIVFELVRTAKRIVGAYIGSLRESLKSLPDKYGPLLEKLPILIEKLSAIAQRGVDAFVEGSRVVLKVLAETAERLYDSLPPFADAWNWIVDHTEGIAECTSKLIKKLSEKLATVYSGLKSLVNNILSNRTIQNLVAELRNRLQGLLEEFIEDTKEQLETIKSYVLNAVPQREFQEFFEALVDYIQKKANKAAIDDTAALRNIYEKLKATVKKAFADIFTIDFDKGIFRAQIPLPVSLKSLSEFTKVFTFPSTPKITFRVPSYTYGLRELINQIRSGAAVNELFPPFKGYGLLIGSKHYKTFDGRFFDFEGNCQYLLASDFDDGNFTVVVDYDRQGDVSQKSIIVTDGQDTVALKPDHSVVVNGQTVEIDHPKEAGTLLIERLGSYIIVRSNKGAIIGCSVTEDVCAIKVDGYYHGKVLGMLGTMNLEQFDDLRTPNGEIATSIDQFASSWKLDKQCDEPRIISTMIYTTQTAEEKCRAALDSRRSSLRPCYGVVDPTPFKSVCEKLSQKSGYTDQKAVCTASIGYAKACYMSYAKVDPVPACA